MGWWPWGSAWISLGRIDVDRMEQGAIQVGNNVSPRGGGGGGGSQITLINSAGDLSYAAVWHSFVSATSGQGGGGQVPRQAQVSSSRAQCQPKGQPGSPVYTFRFEGGQTRRK